MLHLFEYIDVNPYVSVVASCSCEQQSSTRGGAAESRMCKSTLYCELGLGFHGGIRTVCRAGVRASILLCEVQHLEAASSQDLHTAVAE